MKRTSLVIVAFALVGSACASASESSDVSTTAAPPTTTTVVTTTVGAPTTSTVPEVTTTTLATSDADKEEITALYEIVFSSETGYDEKAPLLDDPSGLEETVTKYLETGESMGGVSLAARRISVTGSVATVNYDLLFGGTPTYPDLTGDAVLIDGVWKVTREMFCSIMASARVGCPAP